MINIILTTYKEPRTIPTPIKQIMANNIKNYELLITAPDQETLSAAKKFSSQTPNLKLIKDKAKGKPAALNLAISKAKGDILILTDGDVFIDENSLKLLLEPFKNPEVGAVSGNPISLNSKKTMLGYWAYLLTKIADKRRTKASELKKRFFCSGYLFAIKKNLFPHLPEILLSEDGFISQNVYKNNYKIAYSEYSKVYVKYPTSFKDWIKQKKRSAGGYNQIRKLTGIEIRSFKKEFFGALDFFKYVSNFKELFWLLALFIARIYLWLIIYIDINLKKKAQTEIWQRVESTK